MIFSKPFAAAILFLAASSFGNARSIPKIPDSDVALPTPFNSTFNFEEPPFLRSITSFTNSCVIPLGPAEPTIACVPGLGQPCHDGATLLSKRGKGSGVGRGASGVGDDLPGSSSQHGDNSQLGGNAQEGGTVGGGPQRGDLEEQATPPASRQAGAPAPGGAVAIPAAPVPDLFSSGRGYRAERAPDRELSADEEFYKVFSPAQTNPVNEIRINKKDNAIEVEEAENKYDKAPNRANLHEVEMSLWVHKAGMKPEDLKVLRAETVVEESTEKAMGRAKEKLGTGEYTVTSSSTGVEREIFDDFLVNSAYGKSAQRLLDANPAVGKQITGFRAWDHPFRGDMFDVILG